MPTAFLLSPGPLDPLWLMLACGALVIVFVHAAAAKLLDRSLFEQHLAAYGVPDALLPAASVGLPLGEALAAAGLVTPWRAEAAGLAAALLALYGGAMAWHRLHGRTLDCGCGGTPLPLSWALVARNAVLIGLCAIAALPALPREIGLADVATALAGLALATVLYTALHQLLRHAAAVAAPAKSPLFRSHS
ncbi:MauE/DoxX family redox-associated membrane protein [Leptothrix discophora]|uniref:Methylamine utilization protein MauE n=1 Tax=Leptothrix discophora TaxID=89 RepID=A0ABT9G3V9_LEPDI|nr:MauE/DoxX family redox-associated membrane protein [Leptothrix discophora]MDP4301159.1 MauE/DoxX family redox-associated membrane protein [Leptothrix discophora]